VGEGEEEGTTAISRAEGGEGPVEVDSAREAERHGASEAEPGSQAVRRHVRPCSGALVWV
jgi:hypothetical protein